MFLYAERQRIIVLKPRHRVEVRMGVWIEVKHFKELRLVVEGEVLVVWHDLLVHKNTWLLHRILIVVQMVALHKLLLFSLLFQSVIMIDYFFLGSSRLDFVHVLTFVNNRLRSHIHFANVFSLLHFNATKRFQTDALSTIVNLTRGLRNVDILICHYESIGQIRFITWSSRSGQIWQALLTEPFPIRGEILLWGLSWWWISHVIQAFVRRYLLVEWLRSGVELLLKHLVFHQVCYGLRLLATKVIWLSETGVSLTEIILVLHARRALLGLIETWAYFCDVHPLDTSNIFDLVLAKFFDFFDLGLIFIVVELHMNKLNVCIQGHFPTREVHLWFCSGTVHRSTCDFHFRLIRCFMLISSWELGDTSKLCQNVLVVELIVHKVLIALVLCKLKDSLRIYGV